jgi:hypothetical protein
MVLMPPHCNGSRKLRLEDSAGAIQQSRGTSRIIAARYSCSCSTNSISRLRGANSVSQAPPSGAGANRAG